MTAVEIAIAEKPCQFIKQNVDDHYCLELLRFFGWYPHARFNELAVIHALNSNHGNLYTKRALRQLVDKGVVRISIDNNISLYSLTEDESLRSLALDLAKLDWHQWQVVLRQAHPSSGQAGQSSNSRSIALAPETLI
jgi:hypothetical protein